MDSSFEPDTRGNPDPKDGFVVGDGRRGAKETYRDLGVQPLDVDRYISKSFAEKERKQLWPKIWHFAGFLSDIPDEGDYFKYDFGSESFLFIRQEGSRVNGLYNVCQHRGRRIILEDFGTLSDKIVCPFHSWAYDLNGALQQVTDRETFRDGVLCDDLKLRAVRCETFKGMVFFTLDPEAQELSQFLGVLVDHLEPYDIENMVAVKDVTVEWPVNWKNAADVFFEAYHVHVVHPQITTAMDDYAVQIDLYDGGISRFLVAFGRASPRLGAQTDLNEDLRAMLRTSGADPDAFSGEPEEVRRTIQESMRQSAKEAGLDLSAFEDSQLSDSWGYTIFPNVQIGLSPESVMIQRWRPHATDPERCYFDVINVVHPDLAALSPKTNYLGWAKDRKLSHSDRPKRRYLKTDEEKLEGLGLVGHQDQENIIPVQLGMHSAAFEGLLLSEQELRLRHYHEEIDRYLRD